MSTETEEIIDAAPAPAPVKAKRPRSQAQLDALSRARERALVARKRYAEERKERMSRPPSPEPQPEPVREPTPEREPSPEPDFSDHADDFSEAEEAPAPVPPSIDKETIHSIIGEYKAEKKRLKEAEPRKKFTLHPSGYYIYNP